MSKLHILSSIWVLLVATGCCNQDPVPYTACVDGQITSGTYPPCPCNADCSPVYIPGRFYTDLGNGRCEIQCPLDVSCSRDGGLDGADGALTDAALTDANLTDANAEDSDLVSDAGATDGGVDR